MNYMIAGYAVGVGAMFLYALSLIGRRRRLARAVERVERAGHAGREQ